MLFKWFACNGLDELSCKEQKGVKSKTSIIKKKRKEKKMNC